MTKPQLRRSSDLKTGLIEDIVEATPQQKMLKSKKHLGTFIRQYFRDLSVEDLQSRSAQEMAVAAVEHLKFAASRKPGEVLIKLFNIDKGTPEHPNPRTIIQIVNDNMPFLVDSVTAAITRQDLTIHVTIHPLMRVIRDAKGSLTGVLEKNASGGEVESFIWIEADLESDPQSLQLLEQELLRVLSDVRLAVSDWHAMRNKILEAAEELDEQIPGLDGKLQRESKALLEWMAADHFTFLGYREYSLQQDKDRLLLASAKGTGLGLLRNESRGTKVVELSKEMRRHTRSRDILIITKANSRSTVHRRSYLDYIGIKCYDENGEVTGEKRFIGLFTSIAYSENPRNIPLLRLKVQRVVERARFELTGHRGKSLMNILNTYPRDELFQASIQDLSRTTIGILNLQDRQKVKFFVRRDTFRRFFSCLVYVPREKYSTAVRRKAEAILLEAFGGIVLDSRVEISEAPLARVHIIVRTPPLDRPKVSIRNIESMIQELVVTWQDRLKDEAIAQFGFEEGTALMRQRSGIFPAAYEDDTPPRIACDDLRRIDDLLEGRHHETLQLYQPVEEKGARLHFKIFRMDKPLPLSEVLPILESLGVKVISERPYKLRVGGAERFWIQDFELDYPGSIRLDRAASQFQDCVAQVIAGNVENDGFNKLVLAAGMAWRQVVVIRCYAKYLLQLRLPFSQNYMEEVLFNHASLAAKMVQQFELQFDPSLKEKDRKSRLDACSKEIGRAIGRVRSLDEDRILRAFAGAISASLRTNYFQDDKAGDPKWYLSVKIDPGKLPETPKPRPKFEIFVYSPEVEGVHLRGGSIARGGIRWSDRREDFRTEVLGLMKAQVVKNTVIVPTGAKGGFVPKRLPTSSAEERREAVIKCYQTFICGLLDLTDNIIDDKVVPPRSVVRRDSDDPYLVVAADKGTATFSDIANRISASYNFWLDDAFASGGSAGYDHKKMAITAKGAWEAVKRHFREFGVDTQKDPFTVVGIGDMSGDVFGNGMLLSRKIKLVGAFNHEYIFLDPTPDMAGSFKERQRLFKMKGSSWADYDPTMISRGGGVFSRQAKKIVMNAELRKLLNVNVASLSPPEVIRMLLKLDVDLLWNGGIGTYVKATTESHADVGDRSNDALRVNADELRCKVIGEGGNLGFTQRARIEYSLRGGRANADFIDNSGGVDSSDREVNIKILLSAAATLKGLERADRNTLLASMTDEVANLVLRNNYLQTQAISMMEAKALERLDEQARLIQDLERSGLLDRELEFLPSEETIAERRENRQGLTRPEIAIILSYAKIDLYNGLISSPSPLDKYLAPALLNYFPTPLQNRYKDLIPGHRLSREILTTLIANSIVNRMGPAFVKRSQEDTNASIAEIAQAYVVVLEVCQAPDIWKRIEALDNQIPAEAQHAMMFEVSRILRHAVYWLLERHGHKIKIEDSIQRLRAGLSAIFSRISSVLPGTGKEIYTGALEHYTSMGAPSGVAKRMAALRFTRPSLDVTSIANNCDKNPRDVASIYFDISERLDTFWLGAAIENHAANDRWHALARTSLRDALYGIVRDITAELVTAKAEISPDAVTDWMDANQVAISKAKLIFDEIKAKDSIDFATLSVAVQELRKLAGN